MNEEELREFIKKNLYLDISTTDFNHWEGNSIKISLMMKSEDGKDEVISDVKFTGDDIKYILPKED